MTIPGADAYGQSQINVWLQQFRNSDLFREDAPCTWRLYLTLRPQFVGFLQKYPFASSRALARHFLSRVPTIEEILQRERELQKFSRRWVHHFLSPTPKVARLEASTEMLQILHELERVILKE
jgi:hypothetical protein